MFLLEMKNSRDHVLNVQSWMSYDRAQVFYLEGLTGGLAMFWKASYEVKVLHSDKRIIDVQVKL